MVAGGARHSWTLQRLHAWLDGGLTVSCQPVESGPLDHDESVLRMACAAVQGGARALRIEGARRVALVRSAVDVPIIGIVKRDLPDWPVRITPERSDVRALVEAGADVIAVDVTPRPRPCSVADLLADIHGGGRLAMADACGPEDALAAWRAGFDIIGTTLSGYVGGAVPDEPDLELVRRLSSAGCRVMAEGRYDTPLRAAQAMQAGAWAVTVGTAITRLEVVTSWFAQGVAAARSA